VIKQHMVCFYSPNSRDIYVIMCTCVHVNITFIGAMLTLETDINVFW